MKIREATSKDYDAVWEIFKSVIQPGDRYVYDPHTKKEELTKHWFAANMKTFVAEENGKISGTYIRRPNHIHFGSHIANCGYIVSKDAGDKELGNLCMSIH